MDEDERRALARHAEGTAVTVHHAVPQLQFCVAHRAQPDGAHRAPARVVDVGCGTGDLTERLAREAAVPVVAVDLSRRMAELARARGLPTANADIGRLPFPDGTFDRVTVAFGLRNMTRKEVALGEMYRVLKPGGMALVLEFSKVWKPSQHTTPAATRVPNWSLAWTAIRRPR